MPKIEPIENTKPQKLSDKLVTEGQQPKLSPNPDGSGYIQQIEAESLETISNPRENVLYIINGRKYKWSADGSGEWVHVPNGPELKLEDKGHGKPVIENTQPQKAPQIFDDVVSFQNDVYYKGKLLELQGGGGGSNVAAPYKLKDYELDLDNMEFSCSAEDAEYIFKNNPVAISMDGVIALARDFTDDESKHDYSRSYTFFEFPDDDQILYYELGVYFDGEEYSSEVKPTDPIGGGGSLDYATNAEIDALFGIQPVVYATFEVGTLTNCSLSGISDGDQIAIGQSLTFTVTGTENNMVGASISNNGVAYTMQEIGSMVTDQGENWFQFTIPMVNGDIVVSFEFEGE